MRTILVTDDDAWRVRLPDVLVVDAQSYLTDAEWVGAERLRVVNLCRQYAYQTTGYYVSLLAAARSHAVFPDLQTVLDMRLRTRVRMLDDELDDTIQRGLSRLRSETFTLSIYFGANVARRYDKLALALFNAVPAPLLRAQFTRSTNGDQRWHLTSLRPIAARRIPEAHIPFVRQQAQRYFAGRRFRARTRRRARFDLAILHAPDAHFAPSNKGALQRFIRAASRQDIAAELITREDMNRLSEFDGLFIRETTYVNHYTFAFASRAEAGGLVVIDDPRSILRCTNKVYMAEVMHAHRVPTPRTLVVGREGVDRVADELGLPCVLKHPDSAFSQGVVRCETRDELEQHAQSILATTELFVAQAYAPTSFDWRIGVLDGQPLYACRYHMAKGHWQIIHTEGGHVRYGDTDVLAVESAPAKVIRTAVRAARLMGDGLYGVDLKQHGDDIVVIEVNDNPNLDAGCEDRVLGDALYARVIEVFARRMEARTRR